MEAHTDVITGLQLLPSGELVSGSKDKTIKVWDPKIWTCLKTLEEGSPIISLQVQGYVLVSGLEAGNMRVWDLSGFNPAPAIEEKKGFGLRQ